MPHRKCVAAVSSQIAGLSPLAKPTSQIASCPKSTRAPSRIKPHDGMPAVPAVSTIWAEPAVEIVTENSNTSSAIEAENRAPSKFPFLISFGVHGGYDSNSTTTSNGSGSLFTDEQLTLSYDRTRGPTNLSILSGVGVIERSDQSPDTNAFLDLSLSHRATERLTLDGRVDAVYGSEPTFNSDVGLNRRAGNYFNMVDLLSATYQWSRRISTVSSFSFTLIRYENALTAVLTDREEYLFGEELRFDLLRNTVLVADYRFLVVNYDSIPQDSTTHFVLVGVEQSFSPRLQSSASRGSKRPLVRTGWRSGRSHF